MYIVYAYTESFRLTSGFLTRKFYVIRNLLKSEFDQPPVTCHTSSATHMFDQCQCTCLKYYLYRCFTQTHEVKYM
jgi:hypothetical protein